MRVVEWLRNHGFDTIHLREENLQRLPDDEIFEKAVQENRIVLTFDLDFGEILARSRGRAPGVILFRLHNTRADHVFKLLIAVLHQDLPEDGFVVTVEEFRYRVRRFPN